jgi:hypothetical protein
LKIINLFFFFFKFYFFILDIQFIQLDIVIAASRDLLLEFVFNVRLAQILIYVSLVFSLKLQKNWQLLKLDINQIIRWKVFLRFKKM